MHALGRTPASPRTAGGSPQGGAGAHTGSRATNRRPLAAGQSCCSASRRRPSGRSALPVRWQGACFARAGPRAVRQWTSGVRAIADVVERLVEQERHTGAEAGPEGRIRPARGKRCHRASEQGIDWTEPLPCRSTMAFHCGEAGASEAAAHGRRAGRQRGETSAEQEQPDPRCRSAALNGPPDAVPSRRPCSSKGPDCRFTLPRPPAVFATAVPGPFRFGVPSSPADSLRRSCALPETACVEAEWYWRPKRSLAGCKDVPPALVSALVRRSPLAAWPSCPPPVSTVVGVAEVPRAICAVVRSLTHGTWANHDGCGGRPLWFRRTVHTVHTELAVVRPSGSMRALDEHRTQRLVPAPSAPRRALAGTLASPRHTPAQAANRADGAEQSV